MRLLIPSLNIKSIPLQIEKEMPKMIPINTLSSERKNPKLTFSKKNFCNRLSSQQIQKTPSDQPGSSPDKFEFSSKLGSFSFNETLFKDLPTSREPGLKGITTLSDDCQRW